MMLRTAQRTRLPRRRPSGFSPATTFEATLIDLAGQRATGALQGASGSVHLADGKVVHAESPFAPGAEELLAGAHGHHSVGELELCRLTALLDAAYFALPQDRVPLSFRPGPPPRPALPRALSAASLRRAVGHRRALLDRVWPCAAVDTAAVTRRAAPARAGPCPSRGRAVLTAADGRRTPSEIARLLGRSAFMTLLDVRRLAAAGLIETATRPVATATTRDAPAAAPPPSPPGPLPYDPSDPEVALLLRLRAALEARL